MTILANYNLILSKTEKDKKIKELTRVFNEFIEIMGYEKNDPNLRDTPKRMAKMYVNELCIGNFEKEPKITIFPNTKNYNEMIISGPIKIKSLCSHHMISFIGNAYVSYIPNNKVIGLSKIARIVQWFMRRPQIQEELTEQISSYLEEKLQPKGVAVVIKAQHLCMTVRGVEENESFMTTSSLKGSFLENVETRVEFFNLIGLNK
jgi:GTP cyclohydrolase I